MASGSIVIFFYKRENSLKAHGITDFVEFGPRLYTEYAHLNIIFCIGIIMLTILCYGSGFIELLHMILVGQDKQQKLSIKF